MERKELIKYFVTILIVFGAFGVYLTIASSDYKTIQAKLLSKSRLVVHFNGTCDSKCAKIVKRTRRPVIMWHGMGDTAFGSIDVERRALEKLFPGIQVFSIQIGSNAIEDEMGGYFVNVNHQIEQVCSAIIKNDFIRAHGSFNAIGFSQGGQFMRGLIQRCPFSEHGIIPNNFISLGGQHQGVFGLPRCLDKAVCNYLRHVLTTAAYEKTVQEHVVQAEYWHDPLKEEDYKHNNIFLADINNEVIHNQTYIKRLIGLNRLVLVQFLQDDMVVPPESSVFGFYKPGQTSIILEMRDTDLYKRDSLGLVLMDMDDQIDIIKVPGRHLQYTMSWFNDEIAKKYLDN